jgi:hypothetical protein
LIEIEQSFANLLRSNVTSGGDTVSMRTAALSDAVAVVLPQSWPNAISRPIQQSVHFMGQASGREEGLRNLPGIDSLREAFHIALARSMSKIILNSVSYFMALKK